MGGGSGPHLDKLHLVGLVPGELLHVLEDAREGVAEVIHNDGAVAALQEGQHRVAANEACTSQAAGRRVRWHGVAWRALGEVCTACMARADDHALDPEGVGHVAWLAWWATCMQRTAIQRRAPAHMFGPMPASCSLPTPPVTRTCTILTDPRVKGWSLAKVRRRRGGV